MENAPRIILVWWLIMADLALMITAGIGFLVLRKKGKRTTTNAVRIGRGVCLALSILCAVPVALVVGYILYLCIM